MRNASTALTTLLNSGSQFFIADLLSIIPLAGSASYFAIAPVDVTCVSQVDNASHTFKAGGVDAAGVVRPIFSVDQIKTVIGTQVDQSTLTLMTSVLATIGGVPWTQQARLGYFDGARISIERAYTATWGDWSAGTLIRFWGRVGSVTPSRNTIALAIVSDLVLLQKQMPRNLYQPGCLHNLYDAGCTLNRASFTVSGTIQAGSTASSFATDLTPRAAHYFELGAITFTSGVNAGVVRTVKSYDNTTAIIVPTAALPVAPATGDTFTIYPGCDKLQSTCSGKFANLAHFRGFPYIPVPEAAS